MRSGGEMLFSFVSCYLSLSYKYLLATISFLKYFHNEIIDFEMSTTKFKI
jgi:hypothetical protein